MKLLFRGLIFALVSDLAVRGAGNQFLSTTLTLQEATNIALANPEALSGAIDYCDNKREKENGGSEENMNAEVLISVRAPCQKGLL